MGTIRETNLKREKRPRSITPERHVAIRNLWLRGLSFSEMATATGIPRSTLHKFVTNVLQPLARNCHTREIGIILQEMAMLRSFAWEQFRKCDQSLKVVSEQEVFYAAAKAGKCRAEAKQLSAVAKRITTQMPNYHAGHWAGIIQWCIEQECRLGGYYRSLPIAPQPEFRVAGHTPDQINEIMLKRLRVRLMEIREQAKIRRQFEQSDNSGRKPLN